MDVKEQAFNDYLRGLKYKELAEKYGVSVNTIKSWKRRYGWSREKGAHKKKKAHPFLIQTQPGIAAAAPPGIKKHALMVCMRSTFRKKRWKL